MDTERVFSNGVCTFFTRLSKILPNRARLHIRNATFKYRHVAEDGPALELTVEYQRRDLYYLEVNHSEIVDSSKDLGTPRQ